jgi:hypothetical protein
MQIFLFYEPRKKWGNKKRVVYVRGGSSTCAFSWGLGTPSDSHPWVPLPQWDKSVVLLRESWGTCMRTWEHIRSVIGNHWELGGKLGGNMVGTPKSQNLLKMQLWVNFIEGLLYHQETLNLEYPTHLTNYYLPTLTCGPLGEGKYVRHFLWWWGSSRTDCSINYWANIILDPHMSKEIEVHNCILISKALIRKKPLDYFKAAQGWWIFFLVPIKFSMGS